MKRSSKMVLLMSAAIASVCLSTGVRAGAVRAREHKVVALCIGVDQSGFSNVPVLQYCEKDAESLGKCLHAKDAEVTVLTGFQATKVSLDKAFQQLGTKLSADDVFVFSVSCPSTKTEGGAQFALSGNSGLMRADSPGVLSAVELKGYLDRLPCTRKFCLLDSCYGGKLADLFARDSVPTESSTLLITSDGLALEDSAGGVITNAVVDGLMGEADLNGDSMISALELEACVLSKMATHKDAGDFRTYRKGRPFNLTGISNL